MILEENISDTETQTGRKVPVYVALKGYQKILLVWRACLEAGLAMRIVPNMVSTIALSNGTRYQTVHDGTVVIVLFTL